jgi:crotonobetaine/carnitine-CoA ligase
MTPGSGSPPTGYRRTADAPRSIGEFVRAAAAAHGDKVAVEVVGRPKTYAAIDRDTDRVAAGMASLGLNLGDNVSLMMKNSLENIDTWLGLTKAGMPEVPINTAYRGDLLQYIVGQSRSRALVIDEDFADRLAPIAADLPGLDHLVVRREGLDVDIEALDLPGHIAVHDLDAVYAAGDSIEPPRPDLRSSDVAVILYTSGTTGPSKGVVLAHEHNLTLARHAVSLMDYTSDDVLYTVFPLFHINAKYTSVLAAMAAGARLVMDDRFSASRFWDICREKNVTAFNYQGALLLMLFKQPERPDDADNPVRVGFGAPCPVDIWVPFEERFGLRLVEVYGMTEIAIATENNLDDFRIGSAGRPSPQYDVEVVDEHDRPVPTGAPGEIVVRPKWPDVMIREYYGMPEVTLDAFRNLWFHTGDRGRFDDDGFLYFIDRVKDCIRRRGENISSWEVEKVVNGHEAVNESAAYGVTSELSEEEVMVAVVLQPGASLTPEALLDHCQPRMAHFAVPRYVRFVAELPKTPSQRIQKFLLRADGITRDTWDRQEAGYEVKR